MTLDEAALARLEGLAKAATPGEWTLIDCSNSSDPEARDPFVCFGENNDGDTSLLDMEDAAFIAAANPSTVLALVGALREARAALAVYRSCRHACVDCFCTKEAKAALAAGGEK